MTDSRPKSIRSSDATWAKLKQFRREAKVDTLEQALDRALDIALKTLTDGMRP